MAAEPHRRAHAVALGTGSRGRASSPILKGLAASLTMHLLHVNGYDMAYVEQGAGAPLVLLHGAMCDLRYWAPQMETFGRRYRTIAPSLRHFWPERWDGIGDDFTIQQHTEDCGRLRGGARCWAGALGRALARRTRGIPGRPALPGAGPGPDPGRTRGRARRHAGAGTNAPRPCRPAATPLARQPSVFAMAMSTAASHYSSIR